MIRPATAADREAFHALTRAYIAESGQHREYSEQRTQDAFEHALSDAATLLLVAEPSSPLEVAAGMRSVELLGGVIAQIDGAFTMRPVCLISMFYVRPDCRGTGLARALMAGVCEWSDSWDCSHTFASANAMLSERDTQQFVNLAAKFNFTPAGSPVLARRNPS